MSLLFLKVKNFFEGLKDEEGQGLIEYALIVLLIAIVVIAILTAVGGSVQNVFTSINDSLQAPGQ